MRTKLLFLILCTAIIFPFLIGCGSVSGSVNSQPASPTPTPIPSQPTPTPTPLSAVPSSFIYGIEAFESDIGYAGGKINSGNGQVISVGAFDDSGLGQNIVIQLIADPQGRFLYSLNLGAFAVGMTIGNPGIAELQINQQTGALTRIAGSPIVFNNELFGELAIDGTSHFLYEPDAGSFDIYAIDQTTGALTKTTSVAAAPSIGNFMTISPNGRFMFNASNDTVETLSVDGNGNLALVQPPVLTGGTAVGVVGQLAVSADSQFLYVMNQGSISIFSIGATGTLTPVIGSPFVTDQNASGMALTPTGNHVYISFDESGTSVVKGFTFDPTASSFTPVAGAVISDNATSVTVDGSGKFAYISENFQLSTYSIDPATGNLTLVSQTTQPVSENTQSMVVVP